MKGIILAGGNGERLKPLTSFISKHMIPIGKYPLIHYSLKKLKNTNIDDVIIVVNKKGIDQTVQYLGDGSKYGLDITYKIQEEPKGIAHALYLTKNFVGNDDCVVVLPDNFYESEINIQDFKDGAKVFLTKVNNPYDYGIVEIKDNKIINIEEKPKNPKSNYCVIGLYVYDNKVFDIIKNLKPSDRGEIEITDVNKIYLQKDKLNFEFLDGWWLDIGNINNLQKAKLIKDGENLYEY